MIIDTELVKNINLSGFEDNICREDHKKIINADAGIHHYKLLGYLSLQFDNSIIIELGTHSGTSSLALSLNSLNEIHTYDVKDLYNVKKQPDNIIRRIGNIFELKEEFILLKSSFIFLDTLHSGIFERKIFNYLKDNNYAGILVMDDIFWSKEMICLWQDIDIQKYDLTFIGHGDELDKRGPAGNIPGTGIVDFSGKVKIV